jgi:hypothetical protein
MHSQKKQALKKRHLQIQASDTTSDTKGMKHPPQAKHQIQQPQSTKSKASGTAVSKRNGHFKKSPEKS